MTEPGDRSQLAQPGLNSQSDAKASPIAADGGFGPMGSDDSEREQTDGEIESVNEGLKNRDDGEDDFGDDFDDFEAGAEDADFGEFNDTTQQAPIPSPIPSRRDADAPPIQPLPAQDIPFVSHRSDPCSC